ncbi:MAG: hypothetical protein LBC40_05865 [Dysgonamonadaceae bacterium]|jgi:hypothetical protein|nr:hypothetical protein [Dysgonamonadaceae bacterium]
MCKKIILIANLLLFSLASTAQKGLSIDSIFNEYGKRQGAVLLDLGKDIFNGHSQIERYKCLIIKDQQDAATRINDAVKRDFKNHGHYGNGIIITEINDNGLLKKAFYALGCDATSRLTEYILYSRNKRKITLIYLNGRFKPHQLNMELEKLKDMFIKVNNKEIKIY